MSYIVPFVALAGLIVAWAWWQSRSHEPWWPKDLRLDPDWQKLTENFGQFAETVGRVMTPAFQQVAEQLARLAEASPNRPRPRPTDLEET